MMMNDPMNHPDESEPVAPKRLVEDLGALYRSPGEVPPIVDHAVIAQARRTLRTPTRRSRTLLRWAGAGAAAAAAVLIVILWRAEPAPTPPTLASARDLNRDGAVDIIDAMLLARQVEAGQVDRSRDINGDGQLTRADADAIAMAAVRLANGSELQ